MRERLSFGGVSHNGGSSNMLMLNEQTCDSGNGTEVRQKEVDVEVFGVQESPANDTVVQSNIHIFFLSSSITNRCVLFFLQVQSIF